MLPFADPRPIIVAVIVAVPTTFIGASLNIDQRILILIIFFSYLYCSLKIYKNESKTKLSITDLYLIGVIIGVITGCIFIMMNISKREMREMLMPVAICLIIILILSYVIACIKKE